MLQNRTDMLKNFNNSMTILQSDNQLMDDVLELRSASSSLTFQEGLKSVIKRLNTSKLLDKVEFSEDDGSDDDVDSEGFEI